jgi:hypothetical protein
MPHPSAPRDLPTFYEPDADSFYVPFWGTHLYVWDLHCWDYHISWLAEAPRYPVWD